MSELYLEWKILEPPPFCDSQPWDWIISGLIGVGVSLTILIQVGGARLRKYLRELNETGERAWCPKF